MVASTQTGLTAPHQVNSAMVGDPITPGEGNQTQAAPDTPYRVDTLQRLILVIGMVAVTVTLLVPSHAITLVALDVIAVAIGVGAWVTASRVRAEIPYAPYIILGVGPAVMGGNHLKLALATNQMPHTIWIVVMVAGTVLSVLPVVYVLWAMVRDQREVSTSNLVIHHIADLLILVVSTIGALLVLQYAPLRDAGLGSFAATVIVMSNVGLVCLAGAVVIGRSQIPALQLSLAIAVGLDLLGDIGFAQAIASNGQVLWMIVAYQALACLPLLIGMTMCNPHDGFRPHFVLEPTNTVRAGMIGLLVVGFLCLPLITPLTFSVPTWAILVSVVMCLLTVRMWTLIGERDHKLNERYRHQIQFRHKIRHDALTDLLIRSVMKDHFHAARVGLNNPAVIALFRLHGIDEVRAQLGHDAGEQAIKALAEAIRSSVGEAAEVFRFRRQEFVAIFTPPTSVDDAEHVVQRAVNQVNRVCASDGSPVGAWVHVGMVAVETNRDFEDAIRWCEVAVNDHREHHSLIARVGEEHIAQVAHVTITDQRLREALRNEAFELVMQPMMDTSHHYCVGFEAFARWKNNDLAPSIFVRSLEQVGLADSFGRWVLGEATQFIAEVNCPVSVNISISHIQNSSFVMDVRQAIEKTGIPPELLTIEFSEQDLSIDLTRLIMTLNQVRDMGVRIAIDDVGSGGLTLAQLSRLPVEIMKIDQVMISKAIRYEDTRQLLVTINQAATNLGLETIAEGVETNDVLNMVIDAGCKRAQGWLWSKELTKADAVHWWDNLGRGYGAGR